jgi:hypothetical protein
MGGNVIQYMEDTVLWLQDKINYDREKSMVPTSCEIINYLLSNKKRLRQGRKRSPDNPDYLELYGQFLKMLLK